MSNKPTIGILGVGKLGTAIGRLAIDAGYPVLISGSKGVENIALTVEILVPNAIAKTNVEVVNKADILFLALPLSKTKNIPLENIGNKIVIDAMNYWPEVDGLKRLPEDPNLSSSEWVADMIKSQRVVKAFNHMGYHDLEYETHSKTPKVIAYSGNDEEAKAVVKQIIADLGFDPLDLGTLEKGRILEPGSPLFGANLTRNEFEKYL